MGSRPHIALRTGAPHRAGARIGGLGDTVLLAGKATRPNQVVGTVKQPFDEREIVRELGAA